MPKLKTYNAFDIYCRVHYHCRSTWPLKRIKDYLKKNGKRRVDALWIAKRKDVKSLDRLWVLLASSWHTPGYQHGLAPKEIRREITEYCKKVGQTWYWYNFTVDNVNARRNVMKMLIRRLEKYEKE